MIRRGVSNAFRLAELERLVTSGMIANADSHGGLLHDVAEEEHVRDLLELHRRGLLGPTLPADAILGTLPHRLAAWLRENRRSAEIVAFAEEHAEADIRLAFESAGGEGARGKSGRKKRYARKPGRNRPVDQQPQMTKTGFTRLRRQKLEKAEDALKAAGGDHAQAASNLGISPASLRLHLSYKHFDERTAEKREAERNAKRPAPREERAETTPVEDRVDPALLAKASAALARFLREQ